MKEAAEIAQATEFIEEKHKKYESPIAQGGSNVSGVRSSVFLSHVRLQRNQKFIFLMTVFQHWIIRQT